MSDRSDASLVEVLSADEGTYTSIARRLAKAEFARRQLPADALTAAVESRLLEAKRRSTSDLSVPKAAALVAAIIFTQGLATLIVLAILAIGLERDGYTMQARTIRWVVGGFVLVGGGAFAAVLVTRSLAALAGS